MNTDMKLKKYISTSLITAAVTIAITGCGGSGGENDEPEVKQFKLVQGNDLNNGNNPLLAVNPGGPGGSPNQSLRAGDVLIGGAEDNIMIGGLGVDVFQGYDGDDIMIGGTEDFNSNVDGDEKGADNRDRAFGQNGNDTFIWAPGDGSDFFDGGAGTDVVILGVVGEAQDAAGNTEGAPFFAVNLPGTDGSQDFDGIYLDENNQPTVRVSSSPGFCTFEDAIANQDVFRQLNIDQIVRFSIRGIANMFDAGGREDDDGLRVSLSLKNAEYVVCTRRELDDNDSTNNIEVFNISGAIPAPAEITDLPEYVQTLIQ